MIVTVIVSLNALFGARCFLTADHIIANAINEYES